VNAIGFFLDHLLLTSMLLAGGMAFWAVCGCVVAYAFVQALGRGRRSRGRHRHVPPPVPHEPVDDACRAANTDQHADYRQKKAAS